MIQVKTKMGDFIWVAIESCAIATRDGQHFMHSNAIVEEITSEEKEYLVGAMETALVTMIVHPV